MAVDREGAEKLRDGLQQKLIWATNKLMQDPDCEGKKDIFMWGSMSDVYWVSKFRPLP